MNFLLQYEVFFDLDNQVFYIEKSIKLRERNGTCHHLHFTLVKPRIRVYNTRISLCKAQTENCNEEARVSDTIKTRGSRGKNGIRIT